jgi:hypothetical protein
MKLLFSLLAIGLLFLTGCRQCYQCTTNVTTSGPGGGFTQSTTEFCGTPKQVEEYEKSGTTYTTATSGGVTITQRTTTSCR